MLSQHKKRSAEKGIIGSGNGKNAETSGRRHRAALFTFLKKENLISGGQYMTNKSFITAAKNKAVSKVSVSTNKGGDRYED